MTDHHYPFNMVLCTNIPWHEASLEHDCGLSTDFESSDTLGRERRFFPEWRDRCWMRNWSFLQASKIVQCSLCGRHRLCAIQMFDKARKVIVCDTRNTFERLSSKTTFISQHFKDAVLRGSCKSQAKCCVVRGQSAHVVAGVVHGDMSWELMKGSRKKSILEYRILGVGRNTRRETALLSYRISNLRMSRPKCPFWASLPPIVAFRISSSVVCLSEKLPNLTSWRSQNKLWCHFAWQAWHFGTFQRLCPSVENRFEWEALQRCTHLFLWQAELFRRVVLPIFSESQWNCCDKMQMSWQA